MIRSMLGQPHRLCSYDPFSRRRLEAENLFLRHQPSTPCRWVLPHLPASVILARRTILTPAALTLRHSPIADCARYANLRRTI
jgi:hypothetical protein